MGGEPALVLWTNISSSGEQRWPACLEQRGHILVGGRGHVGPAGGECQAPGAQRVEKGPWPRPGCSWRRPVLLWAHPGLEALWWEGPHGGQMYEVGGSLDPQLTW